MGTLGSLSVYLYPSVIKMIEFSASNNSQDDTDSTEVYDIVVFVCDDPLPYCCVQVTPSKPLEVLLLEKNRCKIVWTLSSMNDSLSPLQLSKTRTCHSNWSCLS